VQRPRITESTVNEIHSRVITRSRRVLLSAMTCDRRCFLSTSESDSWRDFDVSGFDFYTKQHAMFYFCNVSVAANKYLNFNSSKKQP